MKLKINLSQIDKSKITERSYTNKEGQNVVIKELALETLLLKEPKQIAEGQTWRLMKTHTVIHEQTKEEKANKVPAKFVGEGISFVDKSFDGVDPEPTKTSKGHNGEVIDESSIPF